MTASTPFHVMAKPKGALCNLDCTYCYFLSKERLYPASDFRMSEATLEAFTQAYIESQPGDEVVFSWQGGEPTLLGIGYFERAVAFQKKHQRPGQRIFNTFQTNGTLIDDAWCRFFKAHAFLVGLSLDGPRELHDAYRVDKGGAPTFDRVMGGLDRLKAHDVAFNILTTLHAANAAYPLEVYHFLRDIAGSAFIQFIPIVERHNATGFQEGNTVTDRSITGRQYGTFLNAVFDEWLKRDVGQVFVQIFDVALGIWVGDPASLCIFSDTCGAALALEHNGDLFSCDHYVEPRHRLGNILQTPLESLASLPEQKAFGNAKRDTLPSPCRKCPVGFACNGGCPKDRILITEDGEAGLNYLCEGYKAFFTHIDPAMRRMAERLKAQPA
jgi:uncharacterized protein